MKQATIHDQLQIAYQLLSRLQSAHLDAALLLMHVLQVSRSHLIAWPEKTLCARDIQHFQALLQRRLSGESIAHLKGEKEFWSMTLTVTADTLIPRPDTEILVEQMLQAFTQADLTLLDLGTGTGAIALAMAKERPHWHITATDLYPKTLAVAQKNAEKLGLNHVRFSQGDWFKAVSGRRFDVVVSNPPYIAETDPHLMSPELRHEPRHALASGKVGLDALYLIIEQAGDYLNDQGWLYLEHGFDQAIPIQQKMQMLGYVQVDTYLDLGNHPRMTRGRVK